MYHMLYGVLIAAVNALLNKRDHGTADCARLVSLNTVYGQAEHICGNLTYDRAAGAASAGKKLIYRDA